MSGEPPDLMPGTDSRGRPINKAPWRDPKHLKDANTTRAFMGLEPMPPTIEVEGGALPQQVAAAMHALIEGRAGIYQRANQLVRIVQTLQDVVIGGVKRPAGAVLIMPVTKDYLLYALGRHAIWRRFDARNRDFRVIDAPAAVAAALLAIAGEWQFPVLRGIVTAPTLRPDGSILQAPGYDGASGLFFVPGEAAFQLIPETVTREDALAALERVFAVLDEFQFQDGPRGAHAVTLVAAAMTALSRNALPTAPPFAQNAHKAGSGKTEAGNFVARVTTGVAAPVMSMPDDEAELRKALLAVLLAGDSILMIDNVVQPLDSATLCALVTSATYRDRVLGVSQRVELPTTLTLLFNGNNIEVVGDLTTRVLLTTLDPQQELPDQRPFRRDLAAHLAVERGALVSALLAITRGYLTAGSPAVQAGPSRFREWDTLVRRPLLWLGCADPLATQTELRSQDPVRTSLAALLGAWRESFGDRPATVANAVSAATAPGMSADTRLREALLDVAGDRDGTINGRRLGRYITRHLRRIEGGMRFEDFGEDPLTHRRKFKAAGVTGVSGVIPNPIVGNVNSLDRIGNNAENTENAGNQGYEDAF